MNIDQLSSVNIGDRLVVQDGQFAVDSRDVSGSLIVVDSKALNHTGYWISHDKVSIECVKAYPENFTKVQDEFFGGIEMDTKVNPYIETTVPSVITALHGRSISSQREGGWVLNKGGIAGVGIGIQGPINQYPIGQPVPIHEGEVKIGGVLSKDNVLNIHVNPTETKTADEWQKEFSEILNRQVIGALNKTKHDDMVDSLGVYRPKLEDRKVGKVRVELVDDGFPLALREIAKVMTWAQTAKGYKDHDWLNLPNPEQALSAAASRHRTDNIIQRQVGKSAAIECTDHESKLLHKAHEAFGVLAQLELILRGGIK